jgi:hypothetical protein
MEENSKEATGTPAEQIHKEALERFELVRKDDQRDKAIEDLLFLAAEDGQWEEYQKENRAKRPRYTIDRISGPKDQVIGEQRKTRTGPRIIPQNGGTKEVAKVFTGLIRNIEQMEAASNIHDTAFDEQLTCGYGGWRYLTEVEENSFDDEQNIIMEPIKSAPSSYFWDPNAKKYDKRDSEWQFLISYMSKELYKHTYPKARVVDFDVDEYRTGKYSHWFREHGVRIAEYWRRTPIKKTICLLSDGRIIDLDENEEIIDELAEQGITVVKKKEVNSYKVDMGVMSGAEMLTEMQPWAGKFIPMVPVFGKTAMINGKEYIWGIVRKAKDAQRIYNYGTSTAIETTALTPKSPVIMSTNQMAGHEPEWENFNINNPPVMTYENDGIAPPPHRLETPTVQQALLLQIGQSKEDIIATTGIEPAGITEIQDIQSGVAKQREDERGGTGTFIYRDNLQKSQRFGYEICLDLIPRIYDTARIVKIMGDDEELEDVEINQEIEDEETGKMVKVNDLSQGKYSVLAKTGVAFSTKREQSVDQLIKLAEFSPDDAAALTDLIVSNMDLVQSEVATKRIRKRMINQNLIEPTEEEIKEYGLDQESPPDPMDTALVDNLNMQTEESIERIKKLEAETQKVILDAQAATLDALTKYKKELREQAAAGILISEEDEDVLEGQQVLVQEEQIDVLEGQEIAGSLPMDAKGQQLPQEQELPLNPGSELQQ